MRAERVPAWVPMALSGAFVAFVAVAVMRPALNDAEELDCKADAIEAKISRDATSTGGVARMRESLASLDADLRRLGGERSGEREFRVRRTTARFEELLGILAALDAAPRDSVRRVELESTGTDSVTVVAEVDASLDALFRHSEGAAE
ncbi:MAG: hypothetical protein U0572_08200 [Phycisphaerales bacterium]